MRLMPSDPDIKTIVSRVFDGDINLQPDFQRGEVWGTTKKIRLIDSILREWHVPPIHVIEIKETGQQEVLDGQQRLAAIRDFVAGEIKVDGYIEPFDNRIIEIHGKSFSELPDVWRRKFEKFTIRFYNITDYEPSEPGELFYRLNQPTNLTSAEQRNAYYGPAREQIKRIVGSFEEFGITRRDIGFSNSRMAYDDVIARLCVYLEYETLGEKITAGSLADRYRSKKSFPESVTNDVLNCLYEFSHAIRHFRTEVKFNKATLLSWLIFVIQLNRLDIKVNPQDLGGFIYQFEISRNYLKNGLSFFHIDPEILVELLNVFNDRASSRVADVTSVLIRDLVIWSLFLDFCKVEHINLDYSEKLETTSEFLHYIHRNKFEYDTNEIIIEFIQGTKWGRTI